MIVTPLKHDLALGKSGAGRSTGLHMSDIYGAMFRRLEPKRFDTGEAPDPCRLEAGLAFEEWLEEAMRTKIAGRVLDAIFSGDESDGLGSAMRPGEMFTADRMIAYSPDLLLRDIYGRLIVGEIKLTWMSSKDVPREQSTTFPQKFRKQFVQMMAYCKCVGTVHARLFEYFVNGPYKPMAPEFLVWDIEFNQGELDDNWAALMNVAASEGLLP